jgi:uncharacterized protein YjiS (DUF1127 family)
MLIHVLQIIAVCFTRAADAIARARARARERARSRRSACTMLYLDDHMLRDIGLTRADVVACISSPAQYDPVEFLEVRRERNGRARQPWPDHQSLAA